jgi:alkylation response protein AidB-like acyl-CoA dehydrogenase
VADPVARQRLAALYVEGEVLRLIRLRTLSARLAGREPGAEASVQKLLADEHGQRVLGLAKQLASTNGMLVGSGPAGGLGSRARRGPTDVNIDRSLFPDVDPIWHYGFLFAPALTIGGGTWAVQRNIVAERVLGLPRDLPAARPSSSTPPRPPVGRGRPATRHPGAGAQAGRPVPEPSVADRSVR